MSHRFITEIGEGENIDQVFLVLEKQLRPNRNGNLYLQVRLSDKTGSVTGMMWNASNNVFGSFENGNFVRVQGASQFYNGNLQLIVSNIARAESGDYDEADFVTLGVRDIDELAKRATDMLRSVRNVHLRNLADCFLMDEKFMDKFTRSPAGVKNHHAYHGGLIEHVVSLMELVAVVAPLYPKVDPDLLLCGAFLHDISKIDELTYDEGFGYSDEGQLVGHLVMGVSLLEEKIAEAEQLSGEPFPQELRLRLQHMIVSHHGQLEFGSPKVPMTLEAVALHFLDNLDAKLHSYNQLMEEDTNPDSPWTTYFPAIGRKLYKGLPADG